MGMSAIGAAIDAGAAGGAVDHDVVVEVGPGAGWVFGHTGCLPGVKLRVTRLAAWIDPALGDRDDGIKAAAALWIVGREHCGRMPLLPGRSQAAFVVERNTGQVGGDGVGFGFEREDA